MRQTSATYNAYPPIRHVDPLISFRLIDTDAAGNATPSATDAEDISQLPQLLDELQPPVRTLAIPEPNAWLLDGTAQVLPDDMSGETVGFWSSTLSDTDGRFAAPPSVTMTLSAPASSIGFTLEFESYATAIRVTAYAEEQQLDTITVRNSARFCAIEFPVENYDRVVFEFLATPLPFRRVRLTSVLFGIVQRFDSDTISDLTITADADPAGDTLPTARLVWSFDNLDRKYNLVNPDGIYKYLQDGQIISTSVQIGGEAVDCGRFYFQSATAKDSALTAQITAYDRLYWLDTTQYNGGSSGVSTLEEVVASVLEGTGLSVDLPTDKKSTPVLKSIPQGTSVREALRLLAQAACLSCWIDRDGTLVMRELTLADPVDALTADNMESMDGLSVTEPVEAVVLTVRDEYADQEFEYTAGSGSNCIEVSNPCVQDLGTVAAWILAVKQRRLTVDSISRGNPAVELGDTIAVESAFGETVPAAVYGYELSFSSDGLSETFYAIGGDQI